MGPTYQVLAQAANCVPPAGFNPYVARAERTCINTDANANPGASDLFRQRIRAGEGHCIVRRQAVYGEELDFVSARQQAMLDARGVGVQGQQSRKRGANECSAVVDARAEQARRERQRGQAVSFDVQLARCFHVGLRDAAVNAQAAWDAACGGPGARWGLALSTAKKRCVQSAGAVQPGKYDTGFRAKKGSKRKSANAAGNMEQTASHPNYSSTGRSNPGNPMQNNSSREEKRGEVFRVTP